MLVRGGRPGSLERKEGGLPKARALGWPLVKDVAREGTSHSGEPVQVLCRLELTQLGNCPGQRG